MRAIDMHTTTTHPTEALREADRLMVICNSCRYCEGLCAVFPAMERLRVFNDADLNYLANLCHGCGACFSDCQFSPPHEFAVNVPQTLARVRADSYRDYAWPPALSGLFARNGLASSLITLFCVAIFAIGFMVSYKPNILFATYTGPGAFYALMPHDGMALTFGASFIYAVLAMTLAVRTYWRDISKNTPPIGFSAFLQAAKDAGRLRYLDGGKEGCMNDDDRPTDSRKHYHHATFYGFLLCFASTSTATLYHYLAGREAPYAWWDLPVVLGTLGGIGLVVGPAGLLIAKVKRARELVDEKHFGFDVAFILMLLLTGISGLALLLLRETSVMNLALAVHLGIVLALFFTLPYGKFVHGLYRFLALVKFARDTAPPHSEAA
jgi:citrate/tricarballylate utilization protein